MASSSSRATGAHSKRTDWARRALSPATDSGRSTSPETSGGKRFIEPYRLSEEQRRAMLVSLEQRQIGDEETRALFVASLEYGLAICPRLAAPAGPSPPPAREHPPDKENPAIAALAEAAENLALRIEGLDDATSRRLQHELEDGDRFQRSYNEEYLQSLDCELRRFADIGEPPGQNAPSTSGEPVRAENTRRFVLHAADAFEDCFEIVPDAKPDSPFVTALEAIVAVVGISIPTDPATLARVLGQN